MTKLTRNVLSIFASLLMMTFSTNAFAIGYSVTQGQIDAAAIRENGGLYSALDALGPQEEDRIMKSIHSCSALGITNFQGNGCKALLEALSESTDYTTEVFIDHGPNAGQNWVKNWRAGFQWYRNAGYRFTDDGIYPPHTDDCGAMCDVTGVRITGQ